MKASTKRQKQLQVVMNNLARARTDIQQQILATGRWSSDASLLVAIEQLVKYCRLLEEQLDVKDRNVLKKEKK